MLLRQFRLIVSEGSTGSGYAYVDASGSPCLIAATSRRTAADVMWDALASSTPGSTVAVHHITSVNGWAIDVGLAAASAEDDPALRTAATTPNTGHHSGRTATNANAIGSGFAPLASLGGVPGCQQRSGQRDRADCWPTH